MRRFAPTRWLRAKPPSKRTLAHLIGPKAHRFMRALPKKFQCLRMLAPLLRLPPGPTSFRRKQSWRTRRVADWESRRRARMVGWSQNRRERLRSGVLKRRSKMRSPLQYRVLRQKCVLRTCRRSSWTMVSVRNPRERCWRPRFQDGSAQICHACAAPAGISARQPMASAGGAQMPGPLRTGSSFRRTMSPLAIRQLAIGGRQSTMSGWLRPTCLRTAAQHHCWTA